jgi:DNA repair photolyase
MPILPGLCDDDANLEAVIRNTAEHGGRFVLAGSLTLADQQKDTFFRVLHQHMPGLLDAYQRWYPPGSYAAQGYPWTRIACRVRELCQKYGILDRIPRPIIPGEKFAKNKRIVEQLAAQAYTLEIEGAAQPRIWEYRKAAWAVEDLEQDLGLIHQTLGLKGLQAIPNVGPVLGRYIETMLIEMDSCDENNLG